MEVHLPPDLQQFIDDQVHRGVFPSANEAVCRAVQTFRENKKARDEQEQAIREKIESGLEQLRRGQSTKVPLEQLDEFFETIKQGDQTTRHILHGARDIDSIF